MAPKGGNAKKESGRAKKAENEAKKQQDAAAEKASPFLLAGCGWCCGDTVSISLSIHLVCYPKFSFVTSVCERNT